MSLRDRPLRLHGSAGHAESLAIALTTAGVADDKDPAVDHIAKWLTHLIALEGVPSRYLVPDPAMLPSESIRFFQVDGNWITALVDGAFSIGAAAVGAKSARTPHVARVFRARAAHHLHNRRTDRLGLPRNPARALAVGEGFEQKISGFLLRSSLLDVWPKLELKGFVAEGGTSCDLLRFDILAPGIALGLFTGTVGFVEFAEPAETLHFGIDLDDDGGVAQHRKSLRYAEPNGAHHPGDQILDGTGQPVKATLPLRPNSVSVIDIAGAAATVLQGLKDNGGFGGSEPLFTAAQFAMEMVEGVQQIAFSTALPPHEESVP